MLCDRLKKEHERVRQETARVIIEEQKLSQEVKVLRGMADSLHAVRVTRSHIVACALCVLLAGQQAGNTRIHQRLLIGDFVLRRKPASKVKEARMLL